MQRKNFIVCIWAAGCITCTHAAMDARADAVMPVHPEAAARPTFQIAGILPRDSASNTKSPSGNRSRTVPTPAISKPICKRIRMADSPRSPVHASHA